MFIVPYLKFWQRTTTAISFSAPTVSSSQEVSEPHAFQQAAAYVSSKLARREPGEQESWGSQLQQSV